MMMNTLQSNFTKQLHKTLCTILLLTLYLFPNNNAIAQCHIDDWTALKALYESTGGATNWNVKTGWAEITGGLPTANCNLQNLEGVTLNSLGRVQTLYLTNNNLVGTIPEEIGYLTSIESIGLSNNYLTGEIPSTICNFINLKSIYFHDTFVTGFNNLTGSIPDCIGGLVNLEQLMVQYNNLTGEIPESIENLTQLKKLYLFQNQLSGNIPVGICELTNLTELKLSQNQLEGEIPPCLGTANGNLSSLQHFDVTSNQLTGSIPPFIGNLTNLQHLVFSTNKLTGNIPTSIGNLVNLQKFGISLNFIDGEIPDNFGDLYALQKLWMNDNNLSGSIPSGLGNLSNLNTVYLYGNNLSGTIPAFTNISNGLYLYENYFTCSNIEAGINQNLNKNLYYEPQYITPSNYNNIKSHFIDAINIGVASTTLSPTFNNATGYTYQWKQNGVVKNGETNYFITLQNIQPEDAGKYTLHIQDQSCGMGLEFVADPIYVIVEGFDLYGQEVEYNQIMVEFDNPTKRIHYENEILSPNGGWEADACNCNRELYLWQFPSTEAAADALIAINAKVQTVKTKPVVDGGFNNHVSIGDAGSYGEAFNVFRNSTNTNITENATIFLLDTGLDENGTDNASSYLMEVAPVDDCYNINTASGYNYTDESCNTNFSDDQGHGTFGFNAITNEMNQPDHIDVVPLKIFDQEGKGSLFDMTCAIYHAVDHNADIINLSAGYQGQRSGILESAINYARENGVFICTAAGNDALDIDSTPQYPAYFASQYHYVYNQYGAVIESFRYDNVISVASIDADDSLSEFSNYGQESVTLSAYGDKIHSNGSIASGSSMATYFVARELALEIATDNNRSYKDVWTDFAINCLDDNDATIGKTITGKQLNVPIEPYCESVEDLIQNGDFSIGDSNWIGNVNAVADASWEFTNSKANPNIEDGGTKAWHVTLKQNNINIEKNKRYLISFKTTPTNQRSINVRVTNAIDGQIIYFSQSVYLTKQTERKYFIFESKTIEDPNAKLAFWLGGNDHSVKIDDIVFRELSCTSLNNLVSNGHFDNDTLDWNMYVNLAAQATRSVTWGYKRSWVIDEGTGYWHLQFKQHNIELEPGTYTLSFRARSNGEKDIKVTLRDSTNDYYYEGGKNIDTNWKTFNITINVNVASTDGRLSFRFGAIKKNLFIDDIILVKEETGANQRLSNENVVITKEVNNTIEIKSAFDSIDSTLEEHINAYPNPFNDKVAVELQNLSANKGVVALYSISGKLIKQQAFNNEAIVEFNTADLLPGMYLIQVATGDKVFTQKLLK